MTAAANRQSQIQSTVDLTRERDRLMSPGVLRYRLRKRKRYRAYKAKNREEISRREADRRLANLDEERRKDRKKVGC
jgi:hypothetical protein